MPAQTIPAILLLDVFILIFLHFVLLETLVNKSLVTHLLDVVLLISFATMIMPALLIPVTLKLAVHTPISYAMTTTYVPQTLVIPLLDASSPLFLVLLSTSATLLLVET